MSAISTSGLYPIDQSQLPASVRNGTPAAKNAYETGLAFEEVLVNQLSQELAATATTPADDGSSSDGSSSDGSSSAGSDSGLIGSSDPASSMYAQLLPQALTSGVMSSGGTGLAQQIAAGLDPSLGAKP